MSHWILFVVLEKPQIHFEEDCVDYSVLKGKPVNIWVSITGHPYPKISWTFKDKDVLQDKDIKLMSGGDNHLMSIRKTTKKHQGVYQVKAVNEAGKETKDVSVNVYGKYQWLFKTGASFRSIKMVFH